ncbi:membrane-anchored junction protein [Lepus europaeus]|uniref:membrane-anchored junction protein n=1 Tax=Lepus europaeus TaxID=9983 RepID=UPI002B4750C9|nr:membrane-anchored junction protein [Lepus europaeus]
MSLKPFTYPFPETRFLHVGPSVYKFKIRYGNSIRGIEIENKDIIVEELEDSIRVVLGNLDNLQPFTTEHFVIFPYKSKWERVSHLKFKHGEAVLIPYPFVFTLYVELNRFHENLSPGEAVKATPPGRVLTAKSSGSMMRKRKCTEEPSSPGRPEPARAKTGTSSRSLSKKKPPVESRRARCLQSSIQPRCPCHTTPRNKERKTQQECQQPSASDTTDVREEGSRRRPRTAEPAVPPPREDSLPPPGETAAGGFFGFLRALFPFRYFFRKSSGEPAQSEGTWNPAAAPPPAPSSP